MHTEHPITTAELNPTAATAPHVGLALLALLEDLGYAPADFDIVDEPHSALARELGLLGGLLQLTCRSTGEERLYSTGRGSAWMASVLGDLNAGCFGQARRDGGLSSLARRSAQHAAQEFADTTQDVRLQAYEADMSAPRGGPRLERGRGFHTAGYQRF